MAVGRENLTRDCIRYCTHPTLTDLQHEAVVADSASDSNHKY